MAGGRPPYPNRCRDREASAAWRRGIDAPASGGDAWRLGWATGLAGLREARRDFIGFLFGLVVGFCCLCFAWAPLRVPARTGGLATKLSTI